MGGIYFFSVFYFFFVYHCCVVLIISLLFWWNLTDWNACVNRWVSFASSEEEKNTIKKKERNWWLPSEWMTVIAERKQMKWLIIGRGINNQKPTKAIKGSLQNVNWKNGTASDNVTDYYQLLVIRSNVPLTTSTHHYRVHEMNQLLQTWSLTEWAWEMKSAMIIKSVVTVCQSDTKRWH